MRLGAAGAGAGAGAGAPLLGLQGRRADERGRRGSARAAALTTRRTSPRDLLSHPARPQPPTPARPLPRSTGRLTWARWPAARATTAWTWSAPRWSISARTRCARRCPRVRTAGRWRGAGGAPAGAPGCRPLEPGWPAAAPAGWQRAAPALRVPRPRRPSAARAPASPPQPPCPPPPPPQPCARSSRRARRGARCTCTAPRAWAARRPWPSPRFTGRPTCSWTRRTRS